ncbi:MAG: F0F1 ATP synthase subunit A, partial [Bacteroidetes bacterium]|nr:F0F1 ATP synthase subunit A [Bacteroidota bacterium]
MFLRGFKSLLVAVFTIFLVAESHISFAGGGEGKLDPAKVIMEHIQDAHEFHFFTLKKNEGTEFHASVPLPIILYSPQRGLDVFLSSKFHHGHASYRGYLLHEEKIHAVNQAGETLHDVQVYDFSMTKNVVQMILALTLLVVLMVGVANRYKKGQGITTAPKGFQNAIEPVITFVRDEVAKPNLGHHYKKYLPYLLTIFFFILVNNIFGL